MTSGSPGRRGSSTTDSMGESAFASTMAAAQEGDGRAFERLYRWLAPDITRFASARNAEDPEGVTNEVFLRAFRQLDRFAGSSGSFRAWLFAITRNQLIDGHRARSRRPQYADVEVPDRSVDAAEVEALDLLSLQRVTRLLSSLSDDQRDVILLRMVGDLSLQQVSIIVDKPVTAVKALQRRGLRRLQSEVLSEVMTS